MKVYILGFSLESKIGVIKLIVEAMRELKERFPRACFLNLEVRLSLKLPEREFKAIENLNRL